jgi:hypothetical protein
MSEPAGGTTPSAAPLDYAPQTQGWARRRWKRILSLALLAALALAAWVWRRDVRDAATRARLLYAQHRCMTFDPPSDRVTYEDDPAKVQALLSDPEYFIARSPDGTPAAALYWPAVYRNWPEAVTYHRWSTPAVLFLHEMKTPAGEPVLVFAIAEYGTQFPDSLLVRIQEVEPATWRQRSSGGHGLVTRMVKPPYDRQAYVPNPKFVPVRLYAGRVDPGDPSHFTVDYDGSGHRGVMEGWLRDTSKGGEGIELRFRPVIAPNPQTRSLDAGPSAPDKRAP